MGMSKSASAMLWVIVAVLSHKGRPAPSDNTAKGKCQGLVALHT